MDQIIRLNVGGKRFDTYLRTLLIDKTFMYYNVFRSLLNKDCPSEIPVDVDGNYFIDEDPEEFNKKLKELRQLAEKENGITFRLKNYPLRVDDKLNGNKKLHGFFFWKS